MLEYIRCPSCGFSLSDKYDIFIEERARKIKESIPEGVAPEKIELTRNINTDMSDVFEKLGISKAKMCCRMRLTTATSMQEMIR